jgi:hypothetical protein
MSQEPRPKVQVIYLPRPCGCSTPVCAIRTKRQGDTITIDSHKRIVNSSCAGRTPGSTRVTGWLRPSEWIKQNTHRPDIAQLTARLKAEALTHKERVPRIPETFLL